MTHCPNASLSTPRWGRLTSAATRWHNFPNSWLTFIAWSICTSVATESQTYREIFRNCASKYMNIYYLRTLSKIQFNLFFGMRWVLEIFNEHFNFSIFVLSMGGNLLTEVPQSVGQLKSLQALVLSDNQIESLPADIAKLKNLKSLLLHKNKLKTLPQEIVTLKNLTEVTYHSTRTFRNSIKQQIHKYLFVDSWVYEIIRWLCASLATWRTTRRPFWNSRHDLLKLTTFQYSKVTFPTH